MASDGKEILNLPSGYYFDPKDDVAIDYLKQKILGRDLPADIIPTVDNLYTCNPQTIPYDEFRYGTSDCWWFFTSRPSNADSEEEEGVTPHNNDFIVEGIGYWRTSDIVRIEHEGQNIGSKRTRIFFFDNPVNNVRINNLVVRKYITYEFIVEEAAFEPQDLTDNVKQQLKHFVLCKVCIKEMIEGMF